MKIIAAPDKFKGSLTSMQACKAIEAGVHQSIPDAEVLLFPVADGGDGFDEVMQYYLQTQTVTCPTTDPLMRPITAAWQINTDSKTAIIALSAASGMVLLKDEERNPLYTTTYGSGVMIKHAIEHGAEKIILGLGGSATNDAGMGILVAIGFQLLDKNGNQLSPVGGNLQSICNIIPPATIPAVSFEIACDVENVLFGKGGAAYVYAAQKGASANDIYLLDEGLKNIAEVIQIQTGKSVATIPGAGAAGGAAAGLMAYFDCKIIPGAKMVIEASDIASAIMNAALIITGEGKLDMQSSKGKVVQHIIKTGADAGVPVIAVCGMCDLNQEQITEMGLLFVKTIVNNDTSADSGMRDAASLLTGITAAACMDFLKSP
jgi:glycerate 2-kinase